MSKNQGVATVEDGHLRTVFEDGTFEDGHLKTGHLRTEHWRMGAI